MPLGFHNTTQVTSSFKKTQSGFTFIEVLVAVFVISVGLLGLASMQATSLQFNQSSSLRTNATILAEDIIDRMRANSGNACLYLTDYTDTHTTTACDNKASPCSAAQIRESDLAAWKERVQGELPDGQASIVEASCNSGATNTFQINLRWTDRDDNQRTFTIEAQI